MKFDGCAFDPAAFDASVCNATQGSSGPAWVEAFVRPAAPIEDDELHLLEVL